MVQPAAANNQACPGSKVLLNCTVNAMQHSTSITPFLIWEQLESQPARVYYRNGMPNTAQLGDFATTAAFSNNNYEIMSNATINDVSLLHNNKIISCFTPSSENFLTKSIKIAGKCHRMTSIIMITLNYDYKGAEIPPSGLEVIVSSIEPLLLMITWQPPLHEANCTFNYTLNISNSSITQWHMFSSFNLLVLTNLSYEENYSFAVAIIDSIGQHGPWSEWMTWSYGEHKKLYNNHGQYKIIGTIILYIIQHCKKMNRCSKPSAVYSTIDYLKLHETASAAYRCASCYM